MLGGGFLTHLPLFLGLEDLIRALFLILQCLRRFAHAPPRKVAQHPQGALGVKSAYFAFALGNV